MNAAPYTLRILAAALTVAAALAPTAAQAGDFMVRARALRLEPADQNSGPVLPEDSVSVNDKYIWEVDASYFVTPNVAFELIATTPQKQTVSLAGSPIATLRHLPPTLTVQYHFAPENPTVRPYVGAGINYTHFSNVRVTDPAYSGLDIERKSWGTAIQFGADFPITRNLYVNVDFKKIDIRSDAQLNGTYVGTIKVDPVLFGIGIGYRF